MASRHKLPNENLVKGRFLLAFLGMMIAVSAIGTLGRGRLHYLNYWKGPVFAPFGIVVGILAIVVALRGFRRKRG